MGRKSTSGLYHRGGVWHIDKVIFGQRVCESTRTSNRKEAETQLARRIEELRQYAIYGERPRMTWRHAATKYLKDHIEKPSIGRDAQDLKVLDTWVGDKELRLVCIDTFQPYIAWRQSQGAKTSSINRALAVARRILNLSARVWRHNNGLPWLDTPPLIQLLKEKDKRKPYPLDWKEQQLLFSHLHHDLAEMALFKVNTGTREQEVCALRWEWEVPVPEIEGSMFVIPGDAVFGRHAQSGVKNDEDRVIIMNDIASSIIKRHRGIHPTHVFSRNGQPLKSIYNSAWRTAREKAATAYIKELGKSCPAGFRNVRVHDLKHTFGRRLRAAGVNFEDRQDLLGHKSSRVTTHYSAAEIANLVEAANRICELESRKSPALTIVQAIDDGVSV